MKDYRAPFNGNEKLYHQIRVYERQHINVYADQKAHGSLGRKPV